MIRKRSLYGAVMEGWWYARTASMAYFMPTETNSNGPSHGKRPLTSYQSRSFMRNYRQNLMALGRPPTRMVEVNHMPDEERSEGCDLAGSHGHRYTGYHSISTHQLSFGLIFIGSLSWRSGQCIREDRYENMLSGCLDSSPGSLLLFYFSLYKQD